MQLAKRVAESVLSQRRGSKPFQSVESENESHNSLTERQLDFKRIYSSKKKAKGKHSPKDLEVEAEYSDIGTPFDTLEPKASPSNQGVYSACSTPNTGKGGRYRHELDSQQSCEGVSFAPFVQSDSPKTLASRSYSATVSPMPLYLRRGSNNISSSSPNSSCLSSGTRSRAESDTQKFMIQKLGQSMQRTTLPGNCDAVFEEEGSLPTSADINKAMKILDQYKDSSPKSPPLPVHRKNPSNPVKPIQNLTPPKNSQCATVFNFKSLEQVASPRVSRLKPEDFDVSLYEAEEKEKIQIQRQKSLQLEMIETKEEEAPVGHLSLSVKYDVPSNSIVVRVICADLSLSENLDTNRCCLYAQLTLQPHNLVKQTGVKKRCKVPQWNEEIIFSGPYLSSKTIDKLWIEVIVKDFDKVAR